MKTIMKLEELDTKNCLYLTKHFESPFKHLVGCARKIREACHTYGKSWVLGNNICIRHILRDSKDCYQCLTC